MTLLTVYAGIEAPVCTVALGRSPLLPSRNRTVLLGLIRDKDNPLATRFCFALLRGSTHIF